eukprot:GHVH01008617.1.p1 GENE.GHVH01008617.1~~GHVH01008617.1.p1  ORF type:complete len:162 (+),score=12.63 GHVH01008617.1:10-495(+)
MADVNKDTWRMKVFSFELSVFVDVWTPVVFGLLGITIHSTPESASAKRIGTSYTRYAVFLIVQALFGCIGYGGAIGIILAGMPLLSAFLALIVSFFMNSDDKPVCLHVTGRMSASFTSLLSSGAQQKDQLSFFKAQIVPVSALASAEIRESVIDNSVSNEI